MKQFHYNVVLMHRRWFRKLFETAFKDLSDSKNTRLMIHRIGLLESLPNMVSELSWGLSFGRQGLDHPPSLAFFLRGSYGAKRGSLTLPGDLRPPLVFLEAFSVKQIGDVIASLIRLSSYQLPACIRHCFELLGQAVLLLPTCKLALSWLPKHCCITCCFACHASAVWAILHIMSQTWAFFLIDL